MFKFFKKFKEEDNRSIFERRPELLEWKIGDEIESAVYQCRDIYGGREWKKSWVGLLVDIKFDGTAICEDIRYSRIDPKLVKIDLNMSSIKYTNLSYTNRIREVNFRNEQQEIKTILEQYPSILDTIREYQKLK